VNEVANGILQSKELNSATIGIISTGTGGDFIRSVGLERNYLKACSCLAGSNRRLYFFSGSDLRVAGVDVPAGRSVDLRADAAAPLENGARPADLLLLQGRPIREPVAQHGPFVMTTAAEVQQAYLDYRRTRFGGWPWPSDGPVHGPSPRRFARHPDGRVEEPGVA
jgi:hypothetical protein